MFEHIGAHAGDPILGLNEDFQKDPRPGKTNLGIGVYLDDSGTLPLMGAVAQAEAELQSRAGARSYLPMAGLAPYRDALQALVFGPDHAARAEGRIATLQSLGGSGALRVGADFLKKNFPSPGVWISDPSWENHRVVFEAAGFEVGSYPYCDKASGGLRFDAMRDAIGGLPARSIVLLHACCHNPTGVDLTQAQWRTVAALMRERGLIAFVDMAYQGFGDGLDEDAFAPRVLAEAGVACLVASSLSKNFSLYGERVGSLSIVCASKAEADRMLGQLTGAVRANYSNPPTHGAAVVAAVLSSAALRVQWQGELAAMRERIQAMRGAVHAALQVQALPAGATLSRYLTQRGMFTYTGLSASQVTRLREEHGVYLLMSGRMCVAGLNMRNIEAVARAVGEVMRQGG
jgi:aromatic-amino-acid transaminase